MVKINGKKYECKVFDYHCIVGYGHIHVAFKGDFTRLGINCTVNVEFRDKKYSGQYVVSTFKNGITDLLLHVEGLDG